MAASSSSFIPTPLAHADTLGEGVSITLRCFRLLVLSNINSPIKEVYYKNVSTFKMSPNFLVTFSPPNKHRIAKEALFDHLPKLYVSVVSQLWLTLEGKKIVYAGCKENCVKYI
ncbi:UNVERIFIED_CONTAM: hypothetical protein NCL1_46693 [Trichonephila clavipes]